MAKIVKILLLLILISMALVSCGGGGGGGSKKSHGGSNDSGRPNFSIGFPRLAGMNIGEKNYDDQAYQRDLAKLDLVILGFYKN